MLGIVLVHFDTIKKVARRFYDNCGKRRKLGYRDIGRSLFGAWVSIVHDGHFDVMVGFYLQSMHDDILPGEETVSYYLGWTLLIGFSAADIVFMAKVISAYEKTLESEKF